jgi:serine/threonine-protein kinase
MTPHADEEVRPRLLFVDDEQRVLNSMRVMFHRQFELFLASHGAAALDIVKDQDIDVIVADHRMPKMTGVEVLSRVRALSPRTVRILLTGYADLDAVEGSINDSEVFRFLTKPCAPRQLRETIELAAKIARDTAAPAAPLDAHATLAVLEHSAEELDHSAERQAPGIGASRRETPPRDPARTAEMRAPQLAAAGVPDPSKPQQLAPGFGITVFSADPLVLEAVQKAARGRVPVYHAGNIVQVVKTLDAHRPGVLVTDVSGDKDTIQAMTARLKQHVPQLVTIAVSAHRDVLDMVWLINHGQIFRFLRKPLSPGRCAISLQAALQHHRLLLDHPELARRHEVESAPELESGGLMDGVLARIKSMRRLWVQ